MTLPSLTWSPTLTFNSATTPPERRRHIHRGFVGFERDERLLRLDRVARLDHDLDDRHVLEIADVGNADFGDAGRCAASALAAPTQRASSVRCRGAAPSTSSVRIGVPSLTLSPILTASDLTTPAAGDGTSIEALSDSSVIKRSLGCHALARLHHDLDDRDVLEVADVGNADLRQFTHRIPSSLIARHVRRGVDAASARLRLTSSRAPVFPHRCRIC